MRRLLGKSYVMTNHRTTKTVKWEPGSAEEPLGSSAQHSFVVKRSGI
jgi:hypothetical protein